MTVETLKKLVLISLSIAISILLISLVYPANAENIISVKIRPGSLSIRQKNSPDLTADFRNGQAKLNNNILSLIVSDSRGNGGGWSLIVSASDLILLKKEGRYRISAKNLAIKSKPDVSTIAGNRPPKAFGGTIGRSGLKLLSAGSGDGMGDYKVSAKVRLRAPHSVVPDGTFLATITETVIGTP